MFQCLFFVIVNAILELAVTGKAVTVIGLLKSCVTGIFPGWFIAAYIVLFLCSPAINEFVANSRKDRVKYWLVALSSITLLYGWMFNGCSGNESTFLSGYSATFLVILYACVRYVKVHCYNYVNRFSKSFWLGIWCGLCILDVLVWIASAYWGIGEVNSKIFLYTSPVVVVQSFSMFMFFLKLDLHSKFADWLGASSLAVMLLHWSCNGYIFKGISNFILSTKYGVICISYLFGMILVISICAVVIDQIRISIWNVIGKSIKTINF